MWSTPAVWKQYYKMAVLHFFSSKFLSIYSILYEYHIAHGYKLNHCKILTVFEKYTVNIFIVNFNSILQYETVSRLKL